MTLRTSRRPSPAASERASISGASAKHRYAPDASLVPLAALPDGLSLLAIDLSQAQLAQLRSAVNGKRVLEATSMAECEPHLRRADIGIAIFRVPGVAYRDRSNSYGSLLRQYVTIQWIALFEEGSSDLSALTALAREGLDETIRADLLVDSFAVRRILQRLCRGRVADQILQRLDGALPPAFADLIGSALACAHQSLSVPQLAATRRVHERTLRKLCEQEGLPSPQWIVGWARCLVVAYHLQDAGRTVASVASALGFSSATSLGNQMRRYTGRTAGDLRAAGALDAVVSAMHTALHQQKAR